MRDYIEVAAYGGILFCRECYSKDMRTCAACSAYRPETQAMAPPASAACQRTSWKRYAPLLYDHPAYCVLSVCLFVLLLLSFPFAFFICFVGIPVGCSGKKDNQKKNYKVPKVDKEAVGFRWGKCMTKLHTAFWVLPSALCSLLVLSRLLNTHYPQSRCGLRRLGLCITYFLSLVTPWYRWDTLNS